MQVLERDGARLTALQWNPAPERPGVLALHGFTGSGADWRPVAEALRLPWLAPDLRGHGATKAAGTAFSIGDVVDDCLAWSETRNTRVVMGYSMGGRVALRLAARLRSRLGGLVLISASPGIADANARGERARADEALALAIEDHEIAWFVERWSRHPIIRSQARIPPAIRGPMTTRRLNNRPAGLAASLRGMGQGAVEPMWDALATLDVPTLWITGTEDAKYAELVRRASRAMPHSDHIEISGVGHCTHLEALGPFVDAVSPFLEACLSSARGSR